MTGLLAFIAIAALSAPAWWPKVAAILAAKERRHELENARLIKGPLCICSQYPGDPNTDATAEYLKVLILDSGNSWITPEDIRVYKYDPNQGYGKTLSYSFDVWKKLVQEDFDGYRAKWIQKNQSFEQQIFAQNGHN